MAEHTSGCSKVTNAQISTDQHTSHVQKTLFNPSKATCLEETPGGSMGAAGSPASEIAAIRQRSKAASGVRPKVSTTLGNDPVPDTVSRAGSRWPMAMATV